MLYAMRGLRKTESHVQFYELRKMTISTIN